MTQPTLFTDSPRTIADTSREAFEAIRPTLAEREWMAFYAVWRLREYEGTGATGGEVAASLQWATTSARPRLTALLKRGLIERTVARQSTVKGEGRAYCYKPAVPLAAVERAKKGGAKVG